MKTEKEISEKFNEIHKKLTGSPASEEKLKKQYLNYCDIYNKLSGHFPDKRKLKLDIHGYKDKNGNVQIAYSF